MNLCLRNNIRPKLLSTLCRFSTSTSEISEVSDQPVFDDAEDIQTKEAELEKKRNISRLNPYHFNLINGKRPYETPMCTAHETVKYNRKLYGTYGSASGVNPSLCWPTKNDIKERLEYEAVAYPYTIQQMIDMAAEKRKAEQIKIEERQKDIAAKFAKLEQWKKELNDRITKKTAEATAIKEKKERLVEEVRRHFGFKLDPRDERFQEMLAKREKEQKKQEKLAKREAKEQKIFAKLQDKSAQA